VAKNTPKINLCCIQLCLRSSLCEFGLPQTSSWFSKGLLHVKRRKRRIMEGKRREGMREGRGTRRWSNFATAERWYLRQCRGSSEASMQSGFPLQTIS